MNPSEFKVKNLTVIETDKQMKYLYYEGKHFRIRTGDIHLTEGGILPYINKTTKKPFVEYPNGKDDFRRFNIRVLVEGAIKKVFNRIDSYMAKNMVSADCEYSKCIHDGVKIQNIIKRIRYMLRYRVLIKPIMS